MKQNQGIEMCVIVNNENGESQRSEVSNLNVENSCSNDDVSRELKEICTIDYEHDRRLREKEKAMLQNSTNTRIVTRNVYNERQSISPNAGGMAAPIVPFAANESSIPNSSMAPCPSVAPQLTPFPAQVHLPNLKNLSKINDALSKMEDDEAQHNIMRQFIEDAKVKVREGRIFVYNGMFYQERSHDEIRSQLLQFYRSKLRKRASSYLNGIVDFIKIEPDVTMPDTIIRKDFLTFENGLLNLYTGELFKHDPFCITTYAIAAKYFPVLPDAPPHTPTFDSFMNKVSGGDPAWCERLLQIIGYCLTPDTNAKALFLFQGVGNSGKSVLCKFIQKLYSPNSYCAVKAEHLHGRFALYQFFGRALGVCNDMPDKPLSVDAVSNLKELSGNDIITADVKFKNAITFENRAKIILTSNHAIIPKTRDDAFYARLVTLPFAISVDKSEQDPYLLEKLLVEKDGIVTKAMQAYFRLRNANYVFAGFYEPNAVIDMMSGSGEDVGMSIFKYVLQTFEADPDSYVFTDDAYEMFLLGNPYVTRGLFSQYFKRYTQETFDTTNDRKRKPGQLNPLNCVKGIRFKAIAE